MFLQMLHGSDLGPGGLDTGKAVLLELIAAYALGELRHLAIENAVVLALARIRLKRPDLKAISRSMKARRGMTAP